MIGAIIGDIAGSRYEFNNIKTKDFPLFSEKCRFTDDTVMTIAVADALMCSRVEGIPFQTAVTESFQKYGRRYPDAGYGRKFYRWLWNENPVPYNSLGNGSAMRVSPCGLIAGSLEEALSLAEGSAMPTHDHPEGIKGAQAVSGAVWLAKSGADMNEIRDYIGRKFYPLDFTLDEIRPSYVFDVTCGGSVPQAIEAFLESVSFEDAIRNAVSIGGDSDTIACITGSIAWAYYGQYGITDDMKHICKQAKAFLTTDLMDVLQRFEDFVV